MEERVKDNFLSQCRSSVSFRNEDWRLRFAQMPSNSSINGLLWHNQFIYIYMYMYALVLAVTIRAENERVAFIRRMYNSLGFTHILIDYATSTTITYFIIFIF